MNDPIAGDVSAPPTAAFPEAASMPSGETPSLAPPGYEIVCEVGEGGMGVVYRARDCSLDRPVALKYLRPCYERDDSAIARFLYEARITGRLQHPGIPPVHQVGSLPDGRPFLAMKLIEGLTLEALLSAQGPGAARWLAAFEAICQAVGYAHSQGVIHRDLKPSNVMVGAFGEVQVMDWGLAKSLTGDQPAPPTSCDTEVSIKTRPPNSDPGRTPGTDPTRAGSVLGTPAYMPPEQAIGAIDKLDRRSDVFGLGAILCALLTGKPPFVGADSESTRQLAARAKLDDASLRLDSCGAEPELIALAKRCLAADQDDRPRDGGELAGMVAGLRRQAEGRARQAEMEKVRSAVQAQEQARQARLEREHALARLAEQNKRRRLLLSAAGALVLVLLAGFVGTTVGLFRAREARDDEATQRGIAQTKQGEAEKARTEAEEERVKAEQARDLARQRFQQVQLALDSFSGMMFDVQNKLKDHPGTQELRKELLVKARKDLRELRRESGRHGNLDRTLVWSSLRLGDLELSFGNTQLAAGEYAAGHELAKRRAQDAPNDTQAQRDLCVCLEKMGDVTLQLGKVEPASDLYTKSLEIRQRLADADPRGAQAQRDLSVSLSRMGDVTLKRSGPNDAAKFFEKSLRIDESLADADPSDAQAQRDLSVSLSRMGDVTLKRDDPREALRFFKRSLRIDQRLARDKPNDARSQRDLSVSFNRLGDVALQLEQIDEALGYYAKGLEISQRLASADAKGAQAQTDLFISFWKLGSAEKARHEFAKARGWFVKGKSTLAPLSEQKLLHGQAAGYPILAEVQITLCTNAERAVARLAFVFAQAPDAVPDLFNLRVRALLHRKQTGEAIKTAECWRDWAAALGKDRDGQRYDAACALALCAGASTQKDVLVAKAVAVLAALRDAGYFADAKRLAHFGRDADFAAVRSHPAFAAFAQTLKSK